MTTALQPAVSVSSASRPEVGVPYHDVPVPHASEVRRELSRFETLSWARGPADVTALVDMCLRFACLAYRRNAPTTSTGLPICANGASAPSGVELQFRASNGAHSVAYLFRDEVTTELFVVVSFKGSTLSSPGAPVLSDWIANLQPAPRSTPSLPTSSAAQPTHAAPTVHSGWDTYLQSLRVEFEGCLLPGACMHVHAHAHT